MLGKCILFAKIAKYNKVNARHFKIPRALSVVPAGQVATVGQQDEQLFKALARMAEQRLDNFNGQDFANAAWALTDSA